MTTKIFRYLVLLFIATPLLLLTAPGPEAIAQSGPMTRAWVGVILGETDAQPGVEVETVLRRSPAYSAGLQSGDRILSVNDQSVRTTGKLQELLAGQPIGRTITLQVQRAEETFAAEVRLTPAPTAGDVHRLHLRGYESPAVELTTLDGEAIDLSGFNERPLVLEFWATWCTVCRRVSRRLEEAVDKAPGKFDVLAVTSEDAATVRSHLERRPKKLTIALDVDAGAHNAFLVNSYPLVVVIAPDGTVHDVATSLNAIDRIIEELVGGEE